MKMLLRWIRAAEGALSVSAQGCLWCGLAKGVGSDPRSPRLCAGCAAQVPWIMHPVCAVCGRAEDCPDCPRRERSYIQANRSAVQYTLFMKDMLARYKYRGSEKLAPLFGEMACFAYGQLQQLWGERSAAGTVLTFVPLSRRRLEERGFNQAETMARYVGSRFRVPVVPLLIRTRHTEKQSYKSRRERIESLDRAFAPAAGDAVCRLREAGTSRIVLVDDVYTTGSTMQRCGETLLGAAGGRGLEIYGLTWAR